MFDEVQPGSDLVAILSEALVAAGLSVSGADVLVVTQKIISKAENRYVALDSVRPSEEVLRLAKVTHKDPCLVELVRTESTAAIRAAASENLVVLTGKDRARVAGAALALADWIAS
jgi:coenzyme F420-0:L-glutamate ligase/coenzyme F420-1:gamma-L-glutamate ligase